ncbi:NAD(P)H-dependent oxidoreductase [Rhabdobacter roseus]|uniref:Glutathione-regulated potassium-efflux system ancillary protein KefG n=1 Tax=Rhabdobacter roseus TaxID=1655419 RepID=A0A840U076_9BACT|nr:NAD(P)H-dependent oxidoreductase [Rhabdobacter roseus]MBB5287177.1 glutathione-regulated potassium-efflux system ancillary protein KefG [Rhabdobacter roseus]
MPNRVLILFAHPLFEKSRVNKELINQVPSQAGITFHDLYEHYPDFNIDVAAEKELLLAHDIIIWNHPFYWYSCPALLKQWIDMVLEVGWAYGPGGNALQGKVVLQILTTGGPQASYQHEGNNRFTMSEFLAPFDQTVRLCKMHYLPPFVIHGTHRLQPSDIRAQATEYAYLLNHLLNEPLDIPQLTTYTYLNDWLKATKPL